jgi:hypothetical protein
MPLYNCFSNRACEKLKISAEIIEQENSDNFGTSAINYSFDLNFDKPFGVQ